jgi:membrane associated rhomboid family serine protease
MQNQTVRVSEPIFNIPGAVLAAAGLLIAVQIVKGLLPDVEALEFMLALAFIPARYAGAALELPGGYLTAVTSFVTYMIVHAGWMHLTVNLLWMVAFGSAVAKRIGTSRFFAFSILCGIAGALTHLAFHFGEMAPVVGASAAISGQMAAAIRFVFSAQSHGGWRTPDLANVPLATLGETLTNPRILAILGIWVLLNAMFGFGIVSLAGAEGQIAWEAHIGGFLFGLFCFGFFDRKRSPAAPLPA